MRTPSPPSAVVLAACLTLAACTESSSPGARAPDRDAPIEVTLPVDGGPPPTPDGGPLLPVDRAVGAACEDGDRDCDVGGCIPEQAGFPGGYCSTNCRSADECGDGATCGALGSQLVCLDLCEPDAESRSCRAGYGCSTAFGAPICLPGCTDATDCPEGSECAEGLGRYRAGRCFGPGSEAGDPCTASSQCPADGFCGSEAFLGWPGGVCLVAGCDPEAAGGGGCDEGATCIPGFGGGVCVAACTDDGDCRDDYACRDGACSPSCTADTECSGERVCNRANGLCEEPFDPRDYGRSCANEDDVCEGGTCLFEFETGYPGSYCILEGCTPGVEDTCPGSGVCVPDGEGGGDCHLACSPDGTCARAGYACQAVGATAPDGATACLPGCTSNDDCANRGFVCDEDTGLCVSG